ncbi:MAG: ribonuclease HI [Deltaproteobacteria bacterium HGW-Deltaproteobacteria-14]|nr:MAG: ribonuclease HI [Deltaproteobacteria bacterium HGW-Deltaproteobacteria-14]
MRCDAQGQPVAGQGGLVDFRYKPDGKVYRSHADKFAVAAGAAPRALGEAASAPSPGPRKASGTGSRSKAGGPPKRVSAGVVLVGMAGRRPESVSVQVWTDGACSGNPGPAGSGVHYSFGGEVREVSEYLGHGTNNIAELTAMLRGLELVDDPTAPVDLMSDSDYGLKVVAGQYKAKKNQELIAKVQAVLARFSDIQLVKVPGHAGVPGNERADELARLAIERRGNWRS